MSKPLKFTSLVFLLVIITLAGIHMMNHLRAQRYMERYLLATEHLQFKPERMTEDEYLAMGVTEALYLDMYNIVIPEATFILNKKPQLKSPGFLNPLVLESFQIFENYFGLEHFQEDPAHALHVMNSLHRGVLESIPRFYWLPYQNSYVSFFTVIAAIVLVVWIFKSFRKER